LPRKENETFETPPLTFACGKALLELSGRLDEGEAVVGVLLDAGPDGQDVRVEDDVLGGKPTSSTRIRYARPQDLDLPLDGRGLALLVEGHDDDRGAVAADPPGVLAEGLLALLERDRVDDPLALQALSPASRTFQSGSRA
jgi:hypothetical protein